MPRPTLAKVSTAALQAEIERRVSKLADLLKLRDDVDRQIADLKALAGRFGQAVAAEAPAKPVRKYRRGKVKVAKVVAPKKGKRGKYGQTAQQFVLDLLAGKTLTSTELTAAWAEAGRKGRVDNALTSLFKAGTIKRAKIKDGQGSNYSLAGAVAPPVAKKGKRTFTCPTCKKTFGNGPMLGDHYKAEPTHRKK